MLLVAITSCDGYELKLRCNACKINRCVALGLHLSIGEVK
jgi:hypothetical protein